MAKITKAKFWIDLIKKLVLQFAKKQGVRTTPRTWHQHVVPHEDGWAIKREGNKNYTSSHRKQETAIRKARTLAKRYRAEVIIHGQDGTIRDRLSFD